MSDPQRNRKRPLRCRFGFHQWYLDSAFVVSADRCDYCDQFRDEADGQKLVEFRKFVRDHSDLSFEEVVALWFSTRPQPTGDAS